MSLGSLALSQALQGLHSSRDEACLAAVELAAGLIGPAEEDFKEQLADRCQPVKQLGGDEAALHIKRFGWAIAVIGQMIKKPTQAERQQNLQAHGYRTCTELEVAVAKFTNLSKGALCDRLRATGFYLAEQQLDAELRLRPGMSAAAILFMCLQYGGEQGLSTADVLEMVHEVIIRDRPDLKQQPRTELGNTLTVDSAKELRDNLKLLLEGGESDDGEPGGAEEVPLAGSNASRKHEGGSSSSEPQAKRAKLSGSGSQEAMPEEDDGAQCRSFTPPLRPPQPSQRDALRAPHSSTSSSGRVAGDAAAAAAGSGKASGEGAAQGGYSTTTSRFLSRAMDQALGLGPYAGAPVEAAGRSVQAAEGADPGEEGEEALSPPAQAVFGAADNAGLRQLPAPALMLVTGRTGSVEPSDDSSEQQQQQHEEEEEDKEKGSRALRGSEMGQRRAAIEGEAERRRSEQEQARAQKEDDLAIQNPQEQLGDEGHDDKEVMDWNQEEEDEAFESANEFALTNLVTQLKGASITLPMFLSFLVQESYGSGGDSFFRQAVGSNSALVSRAVAPAVLSAFFSQPGAFQAGWAALSRSSSWGRLSSFRKLHLLLKAAAFSLPPADTCWGGRLPMRLPAFIKQPLLEDLFAGACYEPRPAKYSAAELKLLKGFVKQLSLTGEAQTSFQGSAELSETLDDSLADWWQQLQAEVAKARGFRTYAEDWLRQQHGASCSMGQLLQCASQGYQCIYQDALADHAKAGEVLEGPPSGWTFDGLVRPADATEVERFIAAQPELAFGAISSSLDINKMRTISADKEMVKLGMLLCVVSALPEAVVSDECLPLGLPPSVPDSLRKQLSESFERVTNPDGLHGKLTSLQDFQWQQSRLFNYKDLLFGDGGRLTEEQLYEVHSIIDFVVSQDREQLLTEAVVPTVLKAARSHAARSTAARA